MQIDFKKHLRDQLGFLTASCERYDQGTLAEAVRIAAILRTLFRSTPRQTPLVEHLNVTEINLLTTVEQEPNYGPNVVAVFSMPKMAIMRMGTQGARLVPKMGDSGYAAFIPLSHWWGQVVLTSPGIRVSRGELILSAAEKDGGVHIDDKLNVTYATVAAPGTFGMFGFRRNGIMTQVPVEDAHLVSLRQMGYEVLSSPELLQLTQ